MIASRLCYLCNNWCLFVLDIWCQLWGLGVPLHSLGQVSSPGWDRLFVHNDGDRKCKLLSLSLRYSKLRKLIVKDYFILFYYLFYRDWTLLCNWQKWFMGKREFFLLFCDKLSFGQLNLRTLRSTSGSLLKKNKTTLYEKKANCFVILSLHFLPQQRMGLLKLWHFLK